MHRFKNLQVVGREIGPSFVILEIGIPLVYGNFFAIEIKITGIVKVGTVGMKGEFVLEKKIMGFDRFGKVERVV